MIQVQQTIFFPLVLNTEFLFLVNTLAESAKYMFSVRVYIEKLTQTAYSSYV